MDPVAIRLLRLRLGLNQADYADKVGVNRVTVARWEQGDLAPDSTSQAKMSAIAQGSGVDLGGLAALVTLTTLHERADPDTAGHSARVSDLAERLARRLGADETIGDLAVAAMLHDVGKATLPPHVVKYPGRLSRDERRLFEGHVEAGARLAERVAGSRVARFIMEHHEKMNGKGYPMGLRGKRISLGGRILVVADQFDARAYRRAYRRKDQGRAEIVADMRKDPALDPVVVGVLADLVAYAEAKKARARPRALA